MNASIPHFVAYQRLTHGVCEHCGTLPGNDCTGLSTPNVYAPLESAAHCVQLRYDAMILETARVGAGFMRSRPAGSLSERYRCCGNVTISGD